MFVCVCAYVRVCVCVYVCVSMPLSVCMFVSLCDCVAIVCIQYMFALYNLLCCACICCEMRVIQDVLNAKIHDSQSMLLW